MAMMVQTLATTDSNDLYLDSSGNLVMLSGFAAVEAACASATRAQLGEMVLATRQGIPNFQKLWVGVPDYAIWKSYILNTLQNVPGVQRVFSLNLTIQNNIASYVAQIETQYGTGAISG
jgi:hypothetical protein